MLMHLTLQKPTFHRVDKRRDRLYYNQVTQKIYVEPFDDDKHSRKPTALWIFREEVDKAVEAVKDQLPERIQHEVNDSRPYGKTLSVRFFLRIKADRPKNIVSDEDALDIFPSEDVLREIVFGAYHSAVERFNAEQQEGQDIRTAAHVMNWIASKVKDQAKAVCRFEQRLAALKAEFQAEVKVMTPAKLEEALEALSASDKEHHNERVAELVALFTVEFVKETAGDGFPRMFPDSPDNWLAEKLKKDE